MADSEIQPTTNQEETTNMGELGNMGDKENKENKEIIVENIQTEPVSEPVQETVPVIQIEENLQTPPINSPQVSGNIFATIKERIFARREKRLKAIMELLGQKGKITNIEIRKALRISAATATRYCDLLEKRNKIKQVGQKKYAYYIPSG